MKKNGFSLIEVLISVLILSIGMLGLANIISNSIRYTRESNYRAQATLQVNSILDRMRGNAKGLTNHDYDFSAGIPTSRPVCTTCTSAQVAQQDTYDWNQTIAASLPGGVGLITYASGRYTVQVRWDMRNTNAANPVCGTNIETNLMCLSVDLAI